jgi:NADH:ubiquinone oxidoreductase subunit 2 (subunit N)
MINTSQFYILLVFFEFLTLCFYILSSFNYENHGFLIFRFIPMRKLFYFSFFLVCIGIFLFKSYHYINIFVLSGSILESSYLRFIILNREFFLIIGIISILISLVFKMVVFHSPTEFIYYRKTPVMTIIYMHLVPKVMFFYFISEFVYTNYYFLIVNYWVKLVLVCMSLSCLIISIGMRRLFLKHFMEYLSLVNSGYLLLCFVPLTYESLYSSFYFIFFYTFIIFSYGGVCLFIDDQINPGRRISFDLIFLNIEKQDYYTIIISAFFFFF